MCVYPYIYIYIYIYTSWYLDVYNIRLPPPRWPPTSHLTPPSHPCRLKICQTNEHDTVYLEMPWVYYVYIRWGYTISLSLSLFIYVYIYIYIHMDLYQIRLSRTGSGRPLCRPDRHCDDLRVARHTLRYTLRYTLRKIYLLTYLEIYIVPNILSYIYKTFFYIWLIGMTYRYDLWIWPLKSVPALNQCSR